MRDDAPNYALLDRSGAASGMFYPRPETSGPPPGAEDLLIEVEPGIEVGARFYVFKTSNPTVLYFHGNGEIASDHDDIASLYGGIGLNLFVAEFRGYGRSNGQPSVSSLIGDAHPVADSFHAILDLRGFITPRFIMGRSLGAHPALELAATDGRRFRGLILESGVGNVRRMLGRLDLLSTDAGKRLAVAHEAKIRSIAIPTLLIHGEEDELVPLGSAEELLGLLLATGSVRTQGPGCIWPPSGPSRGGSSDSRAWGFSARRRVKSGSSPEF